MKQETIEIYLPSCAQKKGSDGQSKHSRREVYEKTIQAGDLAVVLHLNY